MPNGYDETVPGAAEPTVTLEQLDAGGDLAGLTQDVERLTRAAVTERPPLDTEDMPPGVIAQVLRPGDKVYVRDVENALPFPRSKRGAVTVYNAASLVEYVKRHADERGTTLWARQPSTGAPVPQIVAVLNDHAANLDAADTAPETATMLDDDDTIGLPGWGDHRCTLEVRPDPDWKAWARLDATDKRVQGLDQGGVWLDQVQLAEFLGRQLHTLGDGQAGRVIPAVLAFEAKRNVTFQSATVLQSGELQFQYVSKNSDDVATEKLPRTLTVSLRPFYGAGVVQLEVELRYRLTEGRLLFGLCRVRPDLAEEAAWTDVCDTVAAALPGLPILQGAAPTPLRDSTEVRV